MLTLEQKHKIADDLNGSAQTAADLAEHYGVEPDEIEAAAAECEVELCDQCGWWCETSELNEEQHCEDCQSDEDEQDE